MLFSAFYLMKSKLHRNNMGNNLTLLFTHAIAFLGLFTPMIILTSPTQCISIHYHNKLF